MAESVVFHRGFCVKSPPNPSHRWHRRWFTLGVEEITDIPLFLKSHYKDYKKSFYNNLTPERTNRLVLSYYKNDTDEVKRKSVGKFIIDDSKITDFPSGINDYKYAIEIKLSALYNDRTLHLCFKEDEETYYKTWLDNITGHLENLQRRDSLILSSNVEVYQPCDNNPLQEELEKIRTQITEERLEKEQRESQLFQSSEESDYENFDPDADELDDSELYCNVLPRPSTKF